eukprot:SAG31_NODE_41978_length_273_cov_1.189655_1_plen_31_part_01
MCTVDFLLICVPCRDRKIVLKHVVVRSLACC